jgi:hypothetical protein
MHILGGINKGRVSEVLNRDTDFHVSYLVTDLNDAYTTRHAISILKTETNNPDVIATSLGKPIEVSLDRLACPTSIKIDGVSVLETNFPVKSIPSRGMLGRALHALHLIQ